MPFVGVLMMPSMASPTARWFGVRSGMLARSAATFSVTVVGA